MKGLSFLIALTALPALAADPSATVTGVTRDDMTGSITVKYVLTGADAIVTLGGDASSAAGAWTKLDDSAFRCLQGDVNRLVAASGEAERTVTWSPDPKASAACANGLRVRLTLWSPSAPPDFLAAEIGGAKELRYYVSEAALPYPIADKYWKIDRVLFRKIPAKDVVWNMASISSARFVRLKHDYYLAVYPYTKIQAMEVSSLDTARQDAIASGADWTLCPQFRAGYREWRGEDPDEETAVYPIAQSSVLATVRSKVALAVDFPTEAEWEYAARAGSGGAIYTDESPTSENVQKIAWFADNGGKLNEVGLKRPNRWGLHDVLGNVNEWCLDYYAPSSNDYFKDGSQDDPVEDPVGPAAAQVRRSGTVVRVVRGCYYANGLAEVGKGLNYRDGNIYKGLDSPSMGVRFCAPIPGVSAPKIECGTGRWPSLDTSVKNAYWDCTAYENPAVIEVEEELTDVDCRRCSFDASEEVAPEGVFDSWFRTLGISNTSKLNSWPPTGFLLFLR